MTAARYLFAITRDLPEDTLSLPLGFGDGNVEVVRHAGLDAVVSWVPLEEFGEEPLKRNLEHLRWLEEVARGHDDVVRAVAALGPTAPVRLATICRDDDGVRERLEAWSDRLVEVLDRVAGRSEWSVKVVASPPQEQDRAGSDEPVSGAEFLRRRKERNDRRTDQQDSAARVAEEVHHALAGHAVAHRLLPPQDPQLTGHTGSMVLNAAYLVEDDLAAQFAERARTAVHEHPHLGLEVAGPWPPYSFAVLEGT